MKESSVLLALYKNLLRVRIVEEMVADEYAKQQMRCPVHLSIGQEAVPVGIFAHLTDKDVVFSNHRCHAHYLAKGGSIPKMIAELHGKNTGCSKGKGGSMHLVDVERGMMGASALVSGSMPLNLGAALAFSMRKTNQVAIAFFGDGGSEEGIFYECLNFAALKKLPILFACENNFYATYSHQRARQAVGDIYRRGEPFDIPSVQVDGNDVEAVYDHAKIAVDRARTGRGPTLFEFITYRWRDHVGPAYDHEVGYRTKEEVDSWIAKCPIKRLESTLLSRKILTEKELQQYRDEMTTESKAGFDFALKSPLPEAHELFTDLYANA